ncbi:MAG: PA2169 family four-helix-bundle protein [Candidatus Paceibacterota bacterium]
MEKEKTIDVLNRLVVINNDRIEGYETATENTEENELKTLFSKFAQTSKKCRHDLVSEIEKLGGETEEGTKVSGKFFRVWMDVKSALSSNDRKAILDSCEEGEEWAVDTYNDVLEEKSDHLTQKQQTMVKDQYNSIKTDQNKIRSMQSTLAEAT